MPPCRPWRSGSSVAPSHSQANSTDPNPRSQTSMTSRAQRGWPWCTKRSAATCSLASDDRDRQAASGARTGARPHVGRSGNRRPSEPSSVRTASTLMAPLQWQRLAARSSTSGPLSTTRPFPAASMPGRDSGLQRSSANPALMDWRTQALDRDDDLASGVTVVQVLDGGRGLAERIGAVDGRRELSGLDELR